MSGRIRVCIFAKMFRLWRCSRRVGRFPASREVIIRRCNSPCRSHGTADGGRANRRRSRPKPARFGSQRGQPLQTDQRRDFASFAVPTIMGECPRRTFRDYGVGVKFPAHKSFGAINQCRGELSHAGSLTPRLRKSRKPRIDREG